MVKLKDIAVEAGVTQTTVSYVLNGKAEKNHISRETCDKVRRIAKKLGYRTDDIARAMVKGRANTIGFVAKALISHQFVAAVLEGAMTRADEKDFNIKLLPYYYDTNPEEILSNCIAQRLSGLLCYNFSLETLEFLWKRLSKEGISLVSVTNGEVPNGCGQVTANDRQGGYLATKRLLDLGHEKIAFVSGGYDAKYTQDRVLGYEQALREHGLVSRKSWRVSSKNKADLVAFLEKMSASPNGPTAFFCKGDSEAILTVSCLLGKGFRVPEHFSVVGYGDLHGGRFLFPPLTTVSEPYCDIGVAGVDIICSDLEGQKLENRIKILDVRLLERESSGPANKRRGE